MDQLLKRNYEFLACYTSLDTVLKGRSLALKGAKSSRAVSLKLSSESETKIAKVYSLSVLFVRVSRLPRVYPEMNWPKVIIF